MKNFYHPDETINTLITLIGYHFESNAYGDKIYIDGFELDDWAVKDLMDWLLDNALSDDESMDANTWMVISDYKTIIIDWYGEDI